MKALPGDRQECHWKAGTPEPQWLAPHLSRSPRRTPSGSASAGKRTQSARRALQFHSRVVEGSGSAGAGSWFPEGRGELFATLRRGRTPRSPHARRRRKVSGAAAAPPPAGTQRGQGHPAAGVRDAWGLEAPVPVLGGKHTSPELVLMKERTFPLTCGYAGAGSTGAPEPPELRTQEDAGQERSGRKEGVNHRTLNCYPLQAWGVGGSDRRRREPTQVKEKRPDR